MTATFDESKINRSAVTGKFEDQPEQGLSGELLDDQPTAGEQAYTFLGHWEGEDLVIDAVLHGEQSDDRVEGRDGDNLWAASGSGRSVDHVAQDLRREYEAEEIYDPNGQPYLHPEPLAEYADAFDAGQMRLLGILTDPEHDGISTQDLDDFGSQFSDRNEEVRRVADVLSSARASLGTGGGLPSVNATHDNEGVRDGLEVSMTLGSGSYRVLRDERDFGDSSLTGVAAAVSIAADVEAEYAAVERQARLMQPTVADMRRSVALADAIRDEQRVQWIGEAGVQREGTIRHGTWRGLSGTPEIATAGTDPRTAGVRITLATGTDVYVPWSELDDAMRDYRLALD